MEEEEKMNIGLKRVVALLMTTTLYTHADLTTGFMKFMYAGAQNQNGTIDKSSNVLGIELSHTHYFNENISMKNTLMGIEPIGGGNNCSRIIGSKYTGTKGFGVLGESYLKFENDDSEITFGRQKINTPLLASNPTNMTYETFIHVGTFEALRYTRELNKDTTLDFSLISKYKHRTSNAFYSIGKNITGDNSLDSDYTALLGLQHSFDRSLSGEIWGLKTDGLMRTVYGEMSYTAKAYGFGLNIDIQGLKQNIDSDSKNNTKNPYLKVDDSYLIGAKFAISSKGTKLLLAASKTGDSQIILPWDGSPAFTKICVTSAMTRSIKGSGLKKYAGAYSANTASFKIALIQNFSRFGMPDLKAVAAYANYSSKASSVHQENKMLFLKYDLSDTIKGVNLSAAYTKIDNFDARMKINGKKNPKAWTTQVGQEYEHYKLIMSYRF